MAYNPEQIFEQAIETIKSNSQVVFMEDVIANLPCGKATFYLFFPDKSDELDTLKALLDINKTNLKQGLRAKWENAESAPLQLALYKLVSTPDEARALSMQHIDHTTKGDKIGEQLNLSALSDEEIQQMARLHKKASNASDTP